MCGIVGYLGSRQATEVLVEELFKLEYRGYYSVGDVNSYHHFNKEKTILLVHNGIIENYLKLREEL